MRICLVSSSFYPATFYGGPISATWDLSKRLVEKGVEIYVSTTNANGNKRLGEKTNQFIKKQENLFVKYYSEQIINHFSLALFFGLWKDIKKSDFVYVQYLFNYSVPLALLFSTLQNKRIILCPRGSFSKFTLSNKFTVVKRMWLYFFIKPFQNRIRWQASSYLEKDDIKRVLPNANVTEVNDGVDFDSFQNTKEISFHDLMFRYTNNTFSDISDIFFSMGRLHQIKRFDVLIDAFSLFVKDKKDAKLLIAGGDDGVKSAVENQIKNLGLTASIFLIGKVSHEQKKELLSNCTAFALASEFESFGIVVAEALSCGCPVVVSNKTPWKEIEENNCGIFTQNEKRSFYHAFCKINKENYQKEDCRRYVRAHFDWEVISQDFINSFLTEQ